MTVQTTKAKAKTPKFPCNRSNKFRRGCFGLAPYTQEPAALRVCATATNVMEAGLRHRGRATTGSLSAATTSDGASLSWWSGSQQPLTTAVPASIPASATTWRDENGMTLPSLQRELALPHASTALPAAAMAAAPTTAAASAPAAATSLAMWAAQVPTSQGTPMVAGGHPATWPASEVLRASQAVTNSWVEPQSVAVSVAAGPSVMGGALPQAEPTPRWRRAAWMAVVVLLGLTALGLVVWWTWRQTQEDSAQRGTSSLLLPPRTRPAGPPLPASASGSSSSAAMPAAFHAALPQLQPPIANPGQAGHAAMPPALPTVVHAANPAGSDGADVNDDWDRHSSRTNSSTYTSSNSSRRDDSGISSSLAHAVEQELNAPRMVEVIQALAEDLAKQEEDVGEDADDADASSFVAMARDIVRSRILEQLLRARQEQARDGRPMAHLPL